MKMTIRKISQYILGGFFVFYGLLAINFSVYIDQPDRVLWACYWGMIVIGFGIIIESGTLILIQLNLLAIPLLFWNIDFFYQWLAQKPLWGLTDYFFSELLWPARFITLEHFFLVPLALLALFLVKVKSATAWKFSLLEALGILIFTRLLTDPAHNVNYVFFGDFLPDFTLRWFYVWWYILAIVCICLTNFLVIKIPAFRPKK